MNTSGDILYTGIAFDKFDRLDFSEDFLAGVRLNYFNSDFEPQAGQSAQVVDDNEFFFIYSMQKGQPLSWKVNRNGVVFQNAEILENNCYRVNTYNGSGVIFKRHYFDFEHKWFKSEFFNEGVKYPIYTLYPSVVEGQDVIVKIFSESETTVKSFLYPKTEIPEDDDFSVLAYTEEGFLYFNSVPNERFITRTVIHDDSVGDFGGFDFDSVDFNMELNLNQNFDITTAEYLTEENGNPVHVPTNAAASKKANVFEESQEEEEIKLYKKDNSAPDLNIKSYGDNYKYFGDVDENNRRSGRGRTVTASGSTAYEGEYFNDKRNGFGTFYYKNGKVNYVGHWKDNARQGFGVGFRGSDGTTHVGCWNKNSPDGMGARFDNDGNFIFLGHYVDGKKQGKGITLDDDGSFILSEFRDDEVISSVKIDDLLK